VDAVRSAAPDLTTRQHWAVATNRLVAPQSLHRVEFRCRVRRKETRQKPDADQQAGSPDECRRVIWLQVEKQGSDGTAGKESHGDPKKYTGPEPSVPLA